MIRAMRAVGERKCSGNTKGTSNSRMHVSVFSLSLQANHLPCLDGRGLGRSLCVLAVVFPFNSVVFVFLFFLFDDTSRDTFRRVHTCEFLDFPLARGAPARARTNTRTRYGKSPTIAYVWLFANDL